MEDLKIGTLYCTATLRDEEKSYISSLLPSFFNIEYLPPDGTNKIYARRINIGCLNYTKFHITYCFSKNRKRWSHFNEFISELTDIESFETQNKKFYCYTPRGCGRVSGLDDFDESDNKKRKKKKEEILFIKILGMKDEFHPTEKDTKEFSSPESLEIEAQRQKYLNKIKEMIIHYITNFEKMPTTQDIHNVIGDDVLIGIPMSGKEIPNNAYYFLPLSKITINKTLDIELPDYNNLKINLEPQLKAIYILFLKYNEDGILLKNIANYSDELREIYSIIMPQKDDELIAKFVESICDSKKKYLQEKISKTNSIIRATILNTEISTKYCITGKRNKPYGVHIDRVELPAIFGPIKKSPIWNI